MRSSGGAEPPESQRRITNMKMIISSVTARRSENTQSRAYRYCCSYHNGAVYTEVFHSLSISQMSARSFHTSASARRGIAFILIGGGIDISTGYSHVSFRNTLGPCHGADNQRLVHGRGRRRCARGRYCLRCFEWFLYSEVESQFIYDDAHHADGIYGRSRSG